ncbi:acyl carrier protein [Kitasatospora sp. NPDC098663]|uniref:acyl carrier protein n=1 Tax=Kitasatospora sp. NPDC098663 TaxID=3364096 RepID=UPI00380A9FCF
MTEAELTLSQRTPEEIAAWLADRVSHFLQMPVEEIDPEASLASYGLDSVYVVALCGDITDHLDLPIEPTLLWDIDTLSALTAHLVGLAAE